MSVCLYFVCLFLLFVPFFSSLTIFARLLSLLFVSLSLSLSLSLCLSGVA